MGNVIHCGGTGALTSWLPSTDRLEQLGGAPHSARAPSSERLLHPHNPGQRQPGGAGGDPASCPDMTAPPGFLRLSWYQHLGKTSSRAQDGWGVGWLGCCETPPWLSPFSCSMRDATTPPDQRGGRFSPPGQVSRLRQPAAQEAGLHPPPRGRAWGTWEGRPPGLGAGLLFRREGEAPGSRAEDKRSV